MNDICVQNESASYTDTSSTSTLRTVNSPLCTSNELKIESNNKGPWPCCIGLMANECKVHIETLAPEFKEMIFIINPSDMYTQDVRYDRVRIFVNENGFVYRAPKRG